MINLNSMSPKQLSILATLVAIELSEGLDNNALNVLGNFLTAVSSIMLTIAAQQQNLEAVVNNTNNNDNNDDESN